MTRKEIETRSSNTKSKTKSVKYRGLFTLEARSDVKICTNTSTNVTGSNIHVGLVKPTGKESVRILASS